MMQAEELLNMLGHWKGFVHLLPTELIKRGINLVRQERLALQVNDPLIYFLNINLYFNEFCFFDQTIELEDQIERKTVCFFCPYVWFGVDCLKDLNEYTREDFIFLFCHMIECMKYELLKRGVKTLDDEEEPKSCCLN